ncbi:TldD/PmbA family protein [Planctomycetota bacterium]
MEGEAVPHYGLKSLIESGADKAECVFTRSEKQELNVEAGEISLLRTTFDQDVRLRAIKDQREGSLSLNKTDRQSLDQGGAEVLKTAVSSEADEAHDVAPLHQARESAYGPQEADIDGMFEGVKEFLEEVTKGHPAATMRSARLCFDRSARWFVNSNGVAHRETKALYRFTTVFSSQEGEQTSSFNYDTYSLKDLPRKLLDTGLIRTLLTQSAEQVRLQPLVGKLTGDVILTPHCLRTLLSRYLSFVQNLQLIAGTSVFKDKLGQQIADPKLTVHSRPTSEELADREFVTSDGFAADDVCIIDRGVLRSFLLTLYGANKTGHARAANPGTHPIVEPGTHSLEEMISSVERGMLLCRFSGGTPASNGDFSGVAKNSYYIENGRLQHPVSETMISGNLLDLFGSIAAISRDRVNFGDTIMPWLASPGVVLSGK